MESIFCQAELQRRRAAGTDRNNRPADRKLKLTLEIDREEMKDRETELSQAAVTDPTPRIGRPAPRASSIRFPESLASACGPDSHERHHRYHLGLTCRGLFGQRLREAPAKHSVRLKLKL
jgi:hypothetical protein